MQTTTSRLAWLLAFAVHAAALLAVPVRADQPQGLSPQSIKLPKGPASLKGLGESFAPNPFTGTGSYSVPLSVAPAIHAPSLALVYTAGRGKGIAGLSFDLPIVQIYRTTDKGSPTFTDTDRFAVAGAGLNDELVRVSPTSRLYRLKNEGAHALFEYDVGRETWTIRLPNGDTLQLGTSAQAREVSGGRPFRWWLDRHTDRKAHVIEYTYSEDGGRRYLDAIRYQLYAAGLQNLVKLEYQDRPDPFTDFTYGTAIQTRRRLVGIQMQQGERVLRRYTLRYERSDLHSLLSEVTLTGEDGQSLPTLSFRYVPTAREIRYGSMTGGAGNLLASGEAVFEDVNADALPDILVGRSGAYAYYENMDGTRFASTPRALAGSPACALSAGMLLDFDGDGMRDVVCRRGKEWVYFRTRPLERGEPQGYADGVSVTGIIGAPELNSPFAKAVDLDKNGRTDFLVDNAGSPVTLINEGDGRMKWSDLRTALPQDAPFGLSDVSLTDWNGDGELDFVRKDIEPTRGSMRVWFGRGNGQYEPARNLSGVPAGQPGWYHLQDVNRDGQADLLIYSGRYLSYYLGDGLGGFRQAPVSTNSAPADWNIAKVLFADLNGNGSTDIVWIASNGAISYADLHPDPAAGLLTRVDNGMGLVTDMVYESSTAYAVAAKKANQGWLTPLPHPVPVIEEIRSTDSFDRIGLPATETSVRFDYSHGYYDGREREFRGFARVTVTELGDADHETQVVETWHHVGRNLTSGADEEMLKGKPYLTTVRNDRGETYRTTETRWERRWLCQDETPGLPREVLPRCSGIADRDARKDDLVGMPVATAVLEGHVEAPGLRGEQLATRYEASEVVVDAWGRPTKEIGYGLVNVGSTYVPGAGFTLGNVTAGQDEVVRLRSYVDRLDGDRWLVGLVSCEAVATFSTGGYAADPCATEIVNDPRILRATRHYYDDLPYAGLDTGFETSVEAWVDKDASQRGWQLLGARTYTAHGLPEILFDALGDERRVVYDAATGSFPIREIFQLRPDQASGVTSITHQATYDPGYGVLLTATDPNQRTVEYRYDGLGRILAMYEPEDPDDEPTISYGYEYGTPDHPVSIVTTRELDAKTQRASYSYLYSDAAGRPRLTKVPAEAEIGFVVTGYTEYSARGAKTRTYEAYASSALGMEAPRDDAPFTYRTYDAMGRVLLERRPTTSGARASERSTVFRPMSRHDFDDRDSYERAWLRPTVTTFDGLGRTRQIDKQSEVRGRIETLSFRFDYDATGALVRFRDPRWKSGSDVRSVRDYGYDSLGRLLSVSDPNLGSVTFGYDLLSNPTRREDAVSTTTSTYGSFGRLTRRDLRMKAEAAGAANATYLYHYDRALPGTPLQDVGLAVGKLTGVDYPVGRTLFGYDEDGRATTLMRELWDPARSTYADQKREWFTRKVSFDAFGEAASLDLPEAFHVDMTHARRGAITSAIGGLPGRGRELFKDVRYDVNGFAVEGLLGNGLRSCRTYDARGQVTGLLTGETTSCAALTNPDTNQRAGVQHLRYERAYDDLITNVVDLSKRADDVPDLSARYNYDHMGQLIEARTSYGAYRYAYDELQNLVERYTATTGVETTHSYRYGEQGGPSALTSICTTADCKSPADTKLEYDAVGQLKSYHGYTLSYDAEGHLASAVRTDGDGVRYYYDADGTLVLTETTSIDADRRKRVRVNRHIFDGYETRDGEPVWWVEGPMARAELTRSAGIRISGAYMIDQLSEYVAGQRAKPLPEEYMNLDLDRDGIALDAEDVALVVQASQRGERVGDSHEVWRYYLRDPLESTTHVLDSKGDLVSHVVYAPYGQVYTQRGLDPTWGFAGAYWADKTELGLVHMGARFYAPELGRFISADRYIGESPSKMLERQLEWNLYGYARNNPVVYRDPTGRIVPAVAWVGMWILKAVGEGALDTFADFAMAKLMGEEFGYKEAGKAMAMNTGMAMFGAGMAALGPKLLKLIKLIDKYPGRAQEILGPLKKFVEVGGDKLGKWGDDLKKQLKKVEDKLPKKQSCSGGVCRSGGPCCFVSGTLVATALGLVAIESIEVGDRVMTSGPVSEQTEVDDSWVHISAELELPDHPADVWRVELLRSREWLAKESPDGQTFELAFRTDAVGTARITAIEPAAPPDAGPGRVVLATFDHLSDEVYELTFEGSDSVVRSTWDHPFFSADRGDWVRVAEVEVGERLETAHGALALGSKTELEGSYRVYNLEVEREHEYFVTTDAVRVHNCPELVDLTAHRKDHILNRHRSGAGKPDKTEFPSSWSDDKILHEASDVATDPASVRGVGPFDSPYAIGTKDGIEVRVDFYPDAHPTHGGKISTAYPLNTPKNASKVKPP